MPLHKSFRRAMSYPQAASLDLPRVIDGFFTAVCLHIVTDDTRPSAFRLAFQSLTAHFDTEDQGQGFKKLHAYGVPTNTGFSTCLRCGKDLVAIVQGTEKSPNQPKPWLSRRPEPASAESIHPSCQHCSRARS